MVLAALFLSIDGALAKYLTNTLAVSQVVFFRFLITVLLITPWMACRGVSFLGKNRLVLLFRCLFGFTAAFLQYMVYANLPLGDAMTLLYTVPIFVAILSAVFLKEGVTKRLVAYILCAFLGCMAIIKPRFATVNIYSLVAVLSAFFAALAYVTIKKLHETESFETIIFQFAFFSMVVTFLFFYREFQFPTAPEALGLAGLGVCGTIAQLFLTCAYKFDRASVVSPYSYLAILFALIFGFVFWFEIPDLLSLLGMVVIVASGIGILRMRDVTNAKGF